jgi:hypothetical protein
MNLSYRHFAVNRTGISENRFQGLSTSIEDDRRSRIGDLSRWIGV